MSAASDIFDWSDSDLYTLLAVDRSADADAIHKSFRKLAKLHHPDRYPLDSPERSAAAERFKILVAAHDVLSDPDTRADYDGELDLAERCRPGAYPIDIPPPPPRAAPKPPPRRTWHADAETDEPVEADPDVTFAEVLANPQVRRGGISDASKKSAANAYFTQGIRYYGYGEFGRAMLCFKSAMQLDPSRKVSPYMWAKLTRYSYGFD
jgi:curved DNA-binding protein CbpA